MLLLLSLAAIGVGIALWSKVLTIQGIVSTGSVNAEYVDVFTDDDDFVDDPAFDSEDTGDCEISVGPDDSAFGPENNKDESDGITSCDPSETGLDPKPHYDKDVARCDAVLRDTDPDQEGEQGVAVAITNGYPSYHCTTWLFVRNTGSIPVLLHSVQIGGLAAFPCQLGSTPYDLDGDGAGDLEICVSGFDCIPNDGNQECEEPQIDPGDGFVMDLDMHVMQTAPQNATLTFDAEVCLHQWNEETGNCPQPKVLLYYGNAGPAPDGASPQDLFLLKSHYEVLGYAVDYTDVWPADLSAYGLVYINGPGWVDDSGAAFFSVAQKDALTAYMAGGGRVVVAGDHSGGFGIDTVNDLLAAISGNIIQNADVVTPDADSCIPLTDITPDAVTAGLVFIDPSATSSLTVGGPAVSLARVDPAPYDCGGVAVNGATYLARDGQLVVIGDSNTLDDFGLSDPAGDGSNYGLATNLLTY
jgi:hypothetical protein